LTEITSPFKFVDFFACSNCELHWQTFQTAAVHSGPDFCHCPFVFLSH